MAHVATASLTSNLRLMSQGRARTVGQVLLGWYEIPSQMGQPVDIIVNPAGMEERSRLRCAGTRAWSQRPRGCISNG